MWWTAVGFHGKITSATFEPLRNGARQTVREIVFQFDIGIATLTKFKLQIKNGENLYMKNGWLNTKNASVLKVANSLNKNNCENNRKSLRYVTMTLKQFCSLFRVDWHMQIHLCSMHCVIMLWRWNLTHLFLMFLDKF
jgi:hypothetical protein